MTDRGLRAAISALALVGMGIAAYLVYARLTDTRIACATGGCETVQASRYSEILGIPIAVLGLVAYAAGPRHGCDRARGGAGSWGRDRRRRRGVQRVPALRPARRDRRALPVVPGERRCDGGPCSRNPPASHAPRRIAPPADRQPAPSWSSPSSIAKRTSSARDESRSFCMMCARCVSTVRTDR